MFFHIGGLGDLVLVSGDENVILRRDEIGLNEIRSEIDGELVRGKGVLGAIAACAAMPDHDRAPSPRIPGARCARVVHVPDFGLQYQQQEEGSKQSDAVLP
jgi:hypothetical protein